MPCNLLKTKVDITEVGLVSKLPWELLWGCVSCHAKREGVRLGQGKCSRAEAAAIHNMCEDFLLLHRQGLGPSPQKLQALKTEGTGQKVKGQPGLTILAGIWSQRFLERLSLFHIFYKFISDIHNDRSLQNLPSRLGLLAPWSFFLMEGALWEIQDCRKALMGPS